MDIKPFQIDEGSTSRGCRKTHLLELAVLLKTTTSCSVMLLYSGLMIHHGMELRFLLFHCSVILIRVLLQTRKLHECSAKANASTTDEYASLVFDSTNTSPSPFFFHLIVFSKFVICFSYCFCVSMYYLNHIHLYNDHL
ncbi:PREDICTED: uncharacterized protein LOC106293432 isoform X2 [Brassica oleracea var. oleracea]|uniref:uncharacterized protein LOC106293432 isoform X2 n=1 Tax=Brassica oleracea var. oleracea TaxID=109376 RepID=UPI0006A6AE42|nr:PREDICTED: uncharacterized protein LOC106293432 isoform X2 [Brassica oleracea var. oleracea]